MGLSSRWSGHQRPLSPFRRETGRSDAGGTEFFRGLLSRIRDAARHAATGVSGRTARACWRATSCSATRCRSRRCRRGCSGCSQHGGAGVDVFFILSGLVIVQSLASFGYRPRPFLIARVARIYPVFLVVFAFAVAVQPLATGFARLAWIEPDSTRATIWSGGWPQRLGLVIATHLTMTHGLFPDGVLPDVWVGFLGAAWSLSTEWQFYLLALLIGARLGLRPLAWLFLATCGGVDRLAGGGAGAVAVQPRVPAEQGAVFRARHRQRDRGARGRQGPWCLPCRARRRAGGVRRARRRRQAAAAVGLDGVSGGAAAARRCRFPLPTVIPAKPRAMALSRRRCAKAAVDWPLRLLATTLRSRPLVWLGACPTASTWSTNRCRSCWA